MNRPVTLLPRLQPTVADNILADAGDRIAAGDFRAFTVQLPAEVAYAPVGGSTVAAATLTEFRRELLSIAQEAGFPSDRTPAARARFDTDCAIFLATHPLLQSGEALRDDVWTYIATSLLPDVTAWRYKMEASRWHGGVRNTFQRLWLRARAVDRGEGSPNRWELIEALTEDAFVAIVERPSIGGDPTIALALAEGWLRAEKTNGRGAMEQLMRRAVIRLRLRNEVLALSALPRAKLDRVVDEAFGLGKPAANPRRPFGAPSLRDLILRRAAGRQAS